MNVDPQTIGFEPTIADPSSPAPVSGSSIAQRVYVWTINGLQRTLDRVAPNAGTATPRVAAFSVDEIDWTAMPKILAAAKEQLGMPQGRISGIELSKPMNAVGPPAVLWKVEVTDQNNKKTFILTDASGAMRQVLPPKPQ